MAARAVGTVAGLAVGGAVASAARGPSLMPWPAPVRAAFPLLVGSAAGAATGVKTTFLLNCAGAIAGKRRWPLPTAVGLMAVAAAGGVALVAARAGRAVLVDKMSSQNFRIDDGFDVAPSSAFVSGSAASIIDYASMGREGARFVNTVATAADIEFVTGSKPVAEPIRVFIPSGVASEPHQQVKLALEELRRTGAFDRAHLLIQAPSGSGYADPTAVNVLELLSLGNAATVVISYGLLPSFLSLGEVESAGATHLLLIQAIADEVRERKAAGKATPEILLYGESLGAEVQHVALPLGLQDMDRYGIARGLWVGTPGGAASDSFHLGCASSSILFDNPTQIPAQYRGTTTPDAPRVFFLEHDDDPVVHFRPDLATRRPAWLQPGGPRGRNVPETMEWKPVLTFLEVGVDTLFATNVQPGKFESRGHDYRADMGGTVTAAFRLPADEQTAERLEQRLREMEVARAAVIDGTPPVSS